MWGSFFMMATYMKEGDSFFSFDLWKKRIACGWMPYVLTSKDL